MHWSVGALPRFERARCRSWMPGSDSGRTFHAVSGKSGFGRNPNGGLGSRNGNKQTFVHVDCQRRASPQSGGMVARSGYSWIRPIAAAAERHGLTLSRRFLEPGFPRSRSCGPVPAYAGDSPRPVLTQINEGSALRALILTVVLRPGGAERLWAGVLDHQRRADGELTTIPTKYRDGPLIHALYHDCAAVARECQPFGPLADRCLGNLRQCFAVDREHRDMALLLVERRVRLGGALL